LKLEKLFLIIAAASLIIAIPTAHALKGRTKQLKIERLQKHQLELRIDSVEKQLKQKDDENTDLKKQLEAKRDAQQRVAQASPAPVMVAGVSGNCESYRGIVARYFPSHQINNALLTMSKESGCRPNAVSPTNDHGLMQINIVHSQKVGGNIAALYNPETNIRIASQIFAGRGWTAWYAVRGILW
jgi:hypothetical protein